MFISLYWIDINERMKNFIINKMLLSFGKKWNENIYSRFTKKNCIVDLYYENNLLEGVCISWSYNNYIYLDKFFSINFKKGVGTKMLNLFIEKNIDKSTNETRNESRNESIINKILWRTDLSTSLFYSKNINVITHSENKFNNNNIVYMGVNRITWEYEDIYNIKIKSCFEL